MIQTKDILFETIINETIDLLKKANHSQLVSVTKKIDAVNPLHFFHAAKHLGVDRTFWSSTAEDFFMVGVGTTYRIEATENRFKETNEQWHRVKQEAHVHNPYQKPGTGLVAMGGMSFDPEKYSTQLWEKFSESEFTIPTYLLTKYDNTYYMTVTVQATHDDYITKLNKDLHALIQQPSDVPLKSEITNRKEIEPEQWKQTVKKATDQIKKGKMDKVVLSRELRLKLSNKAVISSVLQDLLDTQTNSFVFAFERTGDCFIGATPERLLKIENEKFLSACLAGTAPRGATFEEDEALANQLFHDEKNRSEHDYVVQMIKEAVSPYCATIEIPNEPIVYPLKNLQHLYTPVTGMVNHDVNIFEIIGKLHPTPALGGVPRKESLHFIREEEILDRGWYGAPIGWLDDANNSEFAVGIRSGLIQGDEASLFAGCGVVRDSDPEAEYEETNIKLLPMLSVLGG